MVNGLPPKALRKRDIQRVEHLGADGRCVSGDLLFDLFEQEARECMSRIEGGKSDEQSANLISSSA